MTLVVLGTKKASHGRVKRAKRSYTRFHVLIQNALAYLAPPLLRKLP